MKYVIVGNGIAGIRAAETIRQLDTEGDITLIADEAGLPYSRPMISMVLEGSVPLENLPIRPAEFYENLRIHTLFGNRISGVDITRRRILIKNHPSIDFDRLLIATGADARQVKAQGSTLEGIFPMRTDAHVRQMVEWLPRVQNPLVLGGGLVGFKAAYGLLKRGLKPTMLISSGYPLSMQVDETAGKMILKELLHHGLKVQVGISVKAFEGNGKVAAAVLSDGSTLKCDMVITGKGVTPATSFMPKDQIPLDQGIPVNDFMETSARHVYAAGDVAQCRDIARNASWVNAIWPEAAMQGQVAGANMAGREFSYAGSLGRNVMRVFDLDLMTMGLANPENESEFNMLMRKDEGRGTYRKLVFRNNTLVGAVLLNHIEQGGVLQALIRNQTPLEIPKEKLLGPAFNYRQLI